MVSAEVEPEGEKAEVVEEKRKRGRAKRWEEVEAMGR